MAVRRLNHAVLYVHDLAGPLISTRGHSASRYAARWPAGPPSCAPRVPPTTTTWASSRSTGPARSPGRRRAVGLYHLAWEVGTLAELDEVRRRLAERGALVGASDHRVTKSLYAKDPSGIEFEVMWRVPAEDWAAELSSGPMIAPLDLAEAQARWGDRATGAAAGSVT